MGAPSLKEVSVMNTNDSPTPSDRFSRQRRFSAFGEEGHARLARSHLAVVGLGGLGSTLAQHAVRAGARKVTLIDRDIVEEHNLPRQSLYTKDDAKRGVPKAEAAAEHLSAVGGPAELVVRVRDLSRRTVSELLEGADLVLDGLDNFEGRFLLNDYCHSENTPWVYGGAVAGNGMALLVKPDGRPCLRCLFPDADQSPTPDTCETVGVLSPLPSLVASLQFCETMRYLSGDNTSRLWNFDPWGGRVFAHEVKKGSGHCACCDEARYPALEQGDSLSAKLCGRDVVQVMPTTERTWDLAPFADRWEGLGKVECTKFLVRLHLPEAAISLFADGRALIQGVDSVEKGRSLYSKYVGS